MSLNGQIDSMVRPRTPPIIPQFGTAIGTKTPGVLAGGTSQYDTPGRRLVYSPKLDIDPNDDETERARVRAARAAQRRRSFGGYLEPLGTGQTCPSSQEDCNILSQESLSALLQNCLKLSNANKINQGNTWDLELIDHLSDLVKNDIDEDEQTNFQLASCTLETGVKIYSYRVDSVHFEAYKLLGGLGRSANDQTTTESPDEDVADQGSSLSQGSKETAKKAGSTLLASDEVLNTKKFDVAFNVDPLFHQTSALFDDGGAQGLLFNNLSVYSGCEVVFDSSEVPEIKMKAQASMVEEGSDSLDLSFMKDTLERMMDVLWHDSEITPTLQEIVTLLNDPLRAEFEAEGALGGRPCHTLDSASPTRSWSESADFDDAQDDNPGEIFNDEASYDNNDVDNASFNEGTSPSSGTRSCNNEAEEDNEGGDSPGDVFMTDPLEWLALSTGITPKSSAWAGPVHWKYAKLKEDSSGAQAETTAKARTERKKKEPFFIDFLNPPEIDQSAFIRPKDPRSLLTRHSSTPKATLLPEDRNSDPSSLYKFFLRPNVWINRRFKRSARGTGAEHFQEMTNEAFWDGDEDNDPSGGWGDETVRRDVEDLPEADLVPEPRKVQKIAVTYDKHAKQVDVRLLKGVLWEQVQYSPSENEQEKITLDKKNGLSFKKILQHFPDDCLAAAPEEISVHLCFICLLHLANEHCLRIDDCSTMDDLRIFFPQSDFKPWT